MLIETLAALSYWAVLVGLVLLAAVACAAMVFYIFEPMGDDDA
jgi:hypothetical protein